MDKKVVLEGIDVFSQIPTAVEIEGSKIRKVEPIKSNKASRRLWYLAKENMPVGFAGEYNQALMDLGALICKPLSPKCDECPINFDCQAKCLGIQEKLPIITRKKPLPHYTLAGAVIRLNNKVIIEQREPDVLLGNLWKFPGGTQQDDENLTDCLKREVFQELGVVVNVEI